jgi:hypothetical protein
MLDRLRCTGCHTDLGKIPLGAGYVTCTELVTMVASQRALARRSLNSRAARGAAARRPMCNRLMLS